MAFPHRFPMGTPIMSYGAPQIFFNPLIARSPATIAAPPQQAEKPAQKSLFVGNISEKCTNEFIQQMLEECGKVANWKRIKGSNGRYQAFGFCDFENEEGTLRALRVLHEFQIGDKKLNLKADDKVREALRAYWNNKRADEGKSPATFKPDELPADEEALKVDEEVRLKLLNMIEKDHPELLIITEDGELSDKEKERKKRDEDRRGKDRRRRSRSRSRSQRRRRSRSPKHKRRRRHSSSSTERSRSDRSSSRSSSRSSEVDRKRRERSRSNRSDRDSEDSDTARERKQLKKQLKEKEHAYVNRLKKWEGRERRMARQYEKEESKEQQRRRDVQKEAKKLRHFLEDYDDERDDLKYYRKDSLFHRKREFEREKEQDAKDRQREQQEIEELKKLILAENKDVENAEEEARRRHKKQEEDALRKLREDSGSPNPHKPLGGDKDDSGSGSSGSESGSESEEEDDAKGAEKENGTVGTPTTENNWKAAVEASDSPSGIVITGGSPSVVKPTTSSRPDLSQRLNGVFGMDDDEEESGRKKMKPFEITREERMQVMTNEERKKMQKQLIEKIPTKRDDLFAYQVDWNYVDRTLIETRVRPWVAKKITEYIGEEEKSLVDFVCDKVINKTQPDQLLKDIAMILDEEAEVFVVKMWRLLIFESEQKKAGLSDKK